jgi:hypothetical protein
MKTVINRDIFPGKKAPSAALTLFGPKVEPKGYIKHSRFIELKPESI